VLLGTEEFVDSLRGRLKGHDASDESPKEQRYAGRPTLEEFFRKVDPRNRAQSDARIAQAYLEYGYTMTAIARCVGLH